MMTETIARLVASAPTLKLVEGAAEYAALKANPPDSRRPAAFVVPLSEVAGPNVLVNAVRQRVAAQLGVVFAVGSLRDPRGEQARLDLEAVRAEARTALLGWAPTASHDPFEFLRGDLVDLRDGVVWWQDRYSSAFYIVN